MIFKLSQQLSGYWDRLHAASFGASETDFETIGRLKVLLESADFFIMQFEKEISEFRTFGEMVSGLERVRYEEEKREKEEELFIK